MYQVIEMYGDCEPWWFFDGWRKKIVQEHQFSTLSAAVDFYQKSWDKFKQIYEQFQNKGDFLSAFWSKKEVQWCEHCNSYSQFYRGLALLKENRPIEPISF